MEELNQEPVTGSKVKRPVLLSILCILTFIGSGMNLISNLFIFFFYSSFKTVAPDIIKTFKIPGMDTILSAQPFFFLVSAAIYGISLGGAYYMWNLQKRGFHLYTVAQILLILALMYFLKLPRPSVADLIISGSFIILYSTNLKYMS